MHRLPSATFGQARPGVIYRPRPAAYAVVLDQEGRVACVSDGRFLFLPGGGREEGESSLETLVREIREECACGFEPGRKLAEAVQFFGSPGGAYEMHATIYLGVFGRDLPDEPEHELHWLPTDPRPALYHECQRWAVGLAVRGDGEG